VLRSAPFLEKIIYTEVSRVRSKYRNSKNIIIRRVGE
jgi:hypothetical protein